MNVAAVFMDDEEGYQAWTAEHPTGFVLNSRRKPNPLYFPLHTSSCHTVTEYRQHQGKPAFTGGSYIKVCSNYPEALLAWIGRFGAKKFSKLCSVCNPEISAIDQVSVQAKELMDEVQRLMAQPAALSEALPTVPKRPGFSFVRTKLFDRSAAVIAAALLRAQGVCESCHETGPFISVKTGKPYLEVHHRTPLAEGGVDHLSNAEAICPNCHRRKHHG